MRARGTGSVHRRPGARLGTSSTTTNRVARTENRRVARFALMRSGSFGGGSAKWPMAAAWSGGSANGPRSMTWNGSSSMTIGCVGASRSTACCNRFGPCGAAASAAGAFAISAAMT